MSVAASLSGPVLLLLGAGIYTWAVIRATNAARDKRWRAFLKNDEIFGPDARTLAGRRRAEFAAEQRRRNREREDW